MERRLLQRQPTLVERNRKRPRCQLPNGDVDDTRSNILLRWVRCSCTDDKERISSKLEGGTVFTLRLEHRVPGPLMEEHPGEERLLIFRSDLHGCIAKLILSKQEDAAKIHSLFVKEEYRGHDLGGLLVSFAMLSLSRYESVAVCYLDVEEDCRRHNQLVHFYECLGCQKSLNSKVTYLHNNDGESYRKIPMQLLVPQSSSDMDVSFHIDTFVPVVILQNATKRVRPQPTHRKIQWLLQEEDGYLIFRTTTGLFLSMSPDGCCDFTCETIHKSQFEVQLAFEDEHCKLWSLVSSDLRWYLSLDAIRGNLCGSTDPSFWYAAHASTEHHSFLLMHTTDTPASLRCAHENDNDNTLSFPCLGAHTEGPSLYEALFTWAPRCSLSSFSSNLCTRAFSIAEAARLVGHADWFQLVALVHDLYAILVPLMGDGSEVCDEQDGSLYMLQLLAANQAEIPQEGLDIILLLSRLAPTDDAVTSPLVREFCELRGASSPPECMSVNHCQHLWASHYERIADKYGLHGSLQW